MHVRFKDLRDLLKGNDPTLRYGQIATFGRGRDADVYSPLPPVGRKHLEVTWQGCSIWLRDLQSRCGTWLNAGRLDSMHWTRIRPGDRIEIAGLHLELSVEVPDEVRRLAVSETVAGLLCCIADSDGRTGAPVLADVLEERGGTDADLLAHLRQLGAHRADCLALEMLRSAFAEPTRDG